MFDILSIQSKPEQEELAGLCDAKYLPDALAYCLKVDGKEAGICQFYIKAGYGEIATLSPAPGFNGNEDGTAEQYLAALCRTALSFLELIGIKTAVYSGEKKTRTLMLASGFKQNEKGEWSTDLKELFAHCPSEGK